MSMNKVILHGRLIKDPTFRNSEYGSYCTFTLVIPDQYVNKSTGERGAAFVDCIAYRHTADFISRYFSKGSYLIMEGHLQNRHYEDRNGTEHSLLGIVCDSVSFGGPPVNGEDNIPSTKAQETVQKYEDKDPVDVIDGILSGEDDFDEILSDGELPF